MLAETFIPNPHNYPIVNHIDGNKLNNSIENLEWCDYSYNTLHAIALGLITRKLGCDSPLSKLDEEAVIFIRTKYKPYDKEYGARALARKFGIDKSNILNIINNKSYKNV